MRIQAVVNADFCSARLLKECDSKTESVKATVWMISLNDWSLINIQDVTLFYQRRSNGLPVTYLLKLLGRSRGRLMDFLLNDPTAQTATHLRMVVSVGFILISIAVIYISHAIGVDITEPNVSKSEIDALYDLYMATNGTHWRWFDFNGSIPIGNYSRDASSGPVWNFTTEIVNPCRPFEWQGVHCACSLSSCSIIELILHRRRMVGKLPTSLSSLSELSVLDLSFNNIFGEVYNFFNLYKLERLDFGTNQLSDSFPENIGLFTQLRAIDVSGNYLSGTIPSSIFQCHQLELLDFSSNHLKGTIPESIGLLQSLSELALSVNGLNGSIPTSLTNLTQLKTLDLDVNNLVGNLQVLTNLTSLEVLKVAHNHLTGTIPSAIANLRALKVLILEGNEIKGTMPEELWSLTNLTYLSLGGNLLYGNISSNISSLVELKSLNLSFNNFAGPFPMTVWNMSMGNLVKIDLAYVGLVGSFDEILVNQKESNVTDLDLFANYLTGTIPELELKNLRYLDLGQNCISGSIPESICDSPVNFLYLDHNLLYHSIPECVGSMTIQELGLGSNSLTGTAPGLVATINVTGGVYSIDQNMLTGLIPEVLCESAFKVINLGSNYLTGTIPNCVFEAKLINITSLCIKYFTIPNCVFEKNLLNVSSLEHFNVSHNVLEGTLPARIGKCLRLTTLAVNHNSLTGSLPDLSAMFSLVFLYVQRNKLSGRLILDKPSYDFDTHGHITNSISFVDISENQISGTLPELLFQSNVPLLSFAAASNCLTGSVPEIICNLPDLLFLDLDGMSTASFCQTPIFPHSTVLTSFLTQPLSGGIPVCLFNMPSLNTLHLSGNSIAWSFPDNLTVSDSLQYLDLSHNKLSGTIPTLIQARLWQDLDLSYNRFVGTLIANGSVPANGSLTLKVNRLSGDIPESLWTMKDINILEGNVFYCDLNRDGLPKNDPAYSNYQCGSNSFNQAAVMWSIFAFCTSISFFAVVRQSICSKNVVLAILRKKYEQWKVYWRIVMEDREFISFISFIVNLNRYVILGMGIIVLIILPVNLALSASFKEQSNQYAWVVSAAYISGFIPGLVLTLMYMGFILMLYLMWDKMNMQRCIHETVTPHKEFVSKLQYFSLSLVVLVNSIIIAAVNGGYVYIVLYKDATVVAFSEVSIALFKLFWNEYAVKYLVKNSRKMYQNKMDANSPSFMEYRISQEMPFLTYMAMFNTLVAPFLASAVVDPNCFRGVFIQPAPVVSTFPYYKCSYFQIEHDGVCNPEVSESASLTVSYDPPFIYSYQCMSSMMSNYASVYVYMFLIAMFIKPPMVRLYVLMYNRLPKSSRLYRWVSYWLSSIYKPADLADISHHRVIFRKEKLVLRFISLTAVLLTFGVLFPPLAIIISGSYATESLLGVISMGRFLNNIHDPITRGLFKEVLVQNSENCWGLFLDPMVELVVPFATIFYGLIVFDIYGDVVGAKRAIWMPALIIVAPFLLYAARRGSALLSSWRRVVQADKEVENEDGLESEKNRMESVDSAKRTRSVLLELRDIENPLVRSESD